MAANVILSALLVVVLASQYLQMKARHERVAREVREEARMDALLAKLEKLIEDRGPNDRGDTWPV